MIKTSHNQKGSTHVIIIVVLVVALLGALGFVFWQNFLAKEPATTDKNKPSSSQPAEEVKNPNEGYLVLEDWKIKFKLPSDVSEITYYTKEALPATNEDFRLFYEFSTKRVEALGEKCVEPGEDGIVTRLAGLRRTGTKQHAYVSSTALNNNEPIGGYYYYLSHAQSICAENGTDIQMQDAAMLVEMLKTPIPY